MSSTFKSLVTIIGILVASSSCKQNNIHSQVAAAETPETVASPAIGEMVRGLFGTWNGTLKGDSSKSCSLQVFMNSDQKILNLVGHISDTQWAQAAGKLSEYEGTVDKGSFNFDDRGHNYLLPGLPGAATNKWVQVTIVKGVPTEFTYKELNNALPDFFPKNQKTCVALKKN